MSKEMSVILLGVAVVAIPYLGIPSEGRTFFLVLAGLTLMIVGFMLRSQSLAREGNTTHHPFVENDSPHIAHDSSQHDHKEGINSLN